MTSAAAAAPAACAEPVPSVAHFGFLTSPNFSMIAFTSAVEVLRMANYVARADHSRWSIFSLDGAPVRASNGIAVRPTQPLDVDDPPDVGIVCGGTRILEAVDERVR
ncbi:GlxA family transcriptional regulator, partial [Burkholderia pseudomallei]